MSINLSAIPLRVLLLPLLDAGWRVVPEKGKYALTADGVYPHGVALLLRRSCVVLGIEHEVAAGQATVLAFVPVAARLQPPDDGIGFADAVTERIDITQQMVGHRPGLLPLFVEQQAADLGLVDPLRFEPPAGVPRDELLHRLYYQYIGRVAASWRGGPRMRAVKELDADERFTTMCRHTMFLAPQVLPDPVPMAAALGITVTCWRNTELENIHVNQQISDVVMAKLNIATTRAVAQYVTKDGIDWNGVAGVLLDPERRIAPQSTSDRGTVGAIVGQHSWAALFADIEKRLEDWRHLDDFAGPDATLILASLAGSTSYTARWWGNSWWPRYARDTTIAVARNNPALFDLPTDTDPATIENDEHVRNVASQLANQPDLVPDELLAELIDQPDGQGLRHGELPVMRRLRLQGVENEV